MNQSLPKGLFKRGGTYAVRFSVPTELQDVVGKREVIRSLGTTSLVNALALRDAKLREIRDGLFSESGPVAAQAKPTTAGDGLTVRAAARRWLSESDGIKPSTRVRYRRQVEALIDYSGNCKVTEIDRSMALQFMKHLRSHRSERTGEPLSQKSLKSYQSCLASFWRVLDYWGVVDPNMRNPFSSLMRRVAGKKQVTDPRAKNLRPVARDEAESFLRYISDNIRLKYQFEMYVTVRLMWVTGCRLNEVCSRYLNDIEDHGDHIRIMIRESKTEAGKRTVMIVGEDDCQLLRQAMTRAVISDPAHPENVGRLFPRIRLGGYDMQPGHYLGKTLENARKNLSGTDVTQWDMHSFRRNAVAALVNAGVAREARNLVIGHSNKDDIGMSVYAKEADLHHLIKTTFQVLYDEIGGALSSKLPVP